MKKFSTVIDILAVVAIIAALAFAFLYAPLSRDASLTLQYSQKIFYFHVASAWVGFFAMFVTFVASIVFLAKRSRRVDDFAASSAELGLVFCSLVLLTGPVWAKAAWNTWWSWDPRLTTTLILWFIYAGYLFLRKFVDEPERRGVYCAVLGIVGFFDVPIVFFSIRWWNTIHPNVVQSGGGGLDPKMRTALFVCLAAFTLLYVSLMNKRTRLAALERKMYEN